MKGRLPVQTSPPSMAEPATSSHCRTRSKVYHHRTKLRPHHRTNLLPSYYRTNHLSMHYRTGIPPSQHTTEPTVAPTLTGPTHHRVDLHRSKASPNQPLQPSTTGPRRTEPTLPGQIPSVQDHQQLYTSKTPALQPHSINRGAGVQQWLTSWRAQARIELSNNFQLLVIKALYL